MEISLKSNVDSICRKLAKEFGVFVMFTKSGEPIDRSTSISHCVSYGSHQSNLIDLPVSQDSEVGEIEKQWEELLNFDIAFVHMRPLHDDDVLETMSNPYFMKQEGGGQIVLSPRKKVARFRRELREATGLSVRVFDQDGEVLSATEALSEADVSPGRKFVDPSMRVGEVLEWFNSVGLRAQLYSMNRADPGLRFSDLVERGGVLEERESGAADKWLELEALLDESNVPECSEIPFSEISPFPLFERLDEHGESVAKKVRDDKSFCSALTAHVNAVMADLNESHVWRKDSLFVILESHDVELNLDVDRSDVLALASSCFSDMEEAKAHLSEAVSLVNDSHDVYQSESVDKILHCLWVAVNHAIETGDEDVLEEWLVGFGYGDYMQWGDEDSVSDIMGDLDMSLRDAVVPAYMSFLKFNLGADVTPEGDLRDAGGDVEWGDVAGHIVEACF